MDPREGYRMKTQRYLTIEEELKIGRWVDNNDIDSYIVTMDHKRVDGVSHTGIKKVFYY